jgi:hypothetical protein
VSGTPSSNRFGWLSDEEDPRVEEVLREDTQAPSPANSRSPQTLDPAPGVPGVTGRAVTGRRRRNRPKDPKALRNDPARMMAGARIRRDVRRRVEQALADPAVGEGTNYSLLVESLLLRWLEEVGYPMVER